MLTPSLTQWPSVGQSRCTEHYAFQISQLLFSPPKTNEQTKTYQQTEQGLRDFNMEISAQKSLVILQIQTLTNPKALSELRMGQTSLKDSGNIAWIRLAWKTIYGQPLKSLGWTMLTYFWNEWASFSFHVIKYLPDNPGGKFPLANAGFLHFLTLKPRMKQDVPCGEGFGTCAGFHVSLTMLGIYRRKGGSTSQFLPWVQCILTIHLTVLRVQRGMCLWQSALSFLLILSALPAYRGGVLYI